MSPRVKKPTDKRERIFPLVRNLIQLVIYREDARFSRMLTIRVMRYRDGEFITEEEIMKKLKAKERRKLLGLDSESSEECMNNIWCL